jgi:hypothetical protein
MRLESERVTDAFSGQNVGVTPVGERIWIVTRRIKLGLGH